MSIKKNYLYTTSYQILLIIIPFITVPYLSRIIGPSGVGVYSYSYSIATYFVLFAKLGLNNYGVRSIAKVKDDDNDLKRAFSSIYYSQIISSIVLILAYIGYLFLFEPENKEIAFILVIYVFSVVLDIDWFYFGIENVKSLMIRNVVIKVITTASIFIFVKHRDDLWLYALIISLGTLVSNSVLWINSKFYLKFEKVKINEIIIHFIPSLKLFIPILAMSVYRTMDKIMVGQLSSMEQVGYYENAEKVIYMLMGFISSLGRVTMPRMTNLLVKGNKEELLQYLNKSMTFIIIMTSALSFGVAAVSKEFTFVFFGDAFMESASLMHYLAITILIVGWANVLRTQYLIPLMKDNIYIFSIALGALLNIIVNLFLIRYLGAMGAVIGTIVAELVVAILQTLYLSKELNIIQMIKSNFKYVVLGLIMYIVVRLIGSMLEPSITTLLIQICCGGGIYLLLIYILDRKTLKELIR